MKETENFEIQQEDIPDFSAIVGFDSLKADLRVSMIEPMRNPTLYEEIGLSAGEKYLLFGPPGCGKSFFARSVAGELRCRCFELVPSNTIGKFYDAVNVVASIFGQARFVRPSVIIIDEVETLTRTRESANQAEFLAAFLNEMLIQFDNTVNDNTKIVVLGTTNAPWHIDTAFLREGRFGKVLFVPPPLREERRIFFSRTLSDWPAGDVETLVRETRLFSFADMAGIIKKARQDTVKDMILAGAAPTKVSDIRLNLTNLREKAQLQFSPTKAWFENFEAHANKIHASMLLPVQSFLKAEKIEN